MRILQVSTSDLDGGAERIAWNLFAAYRSRGYGSWLAVGRRHSADADVLPIAPRAGPSEQPWITQGLAARRTAPAARLVRRLASKASRRYTHLRRSFERWAGIEDLHFPGSYGLLELPPQRPTVLHCHNLHGDYFDLRALPWLSRQVPTFVTLHDAWLLGGHCAHSFGCERWQSGCGHCPGLAIPPALQRDATAFNWRRKAALYRRCRLFIATPSRWLMQKVARSILAPAIVERRVIPNGVDLSIFRPGSKLAARAELGIASERRVLLFAANGIRQNPWKDYQALRSAVALAAARLGRELLFIALGERAAPEHVSLAEIRFAPYVSEPGAVARYYQAADLYLHAAKADTFPNSVLEALACGTPVIAMAVGGIPEQVRGLRALSSHAPDGVWSQHDVNEATGVLLPPADAPAMAAAIALLLNDEVLRRRLGANAAHDARQRFDLTRQVNEYLAWYRAAIEEGACAAQP